MGEENDFSKVSNGAVAFKIELEMSGLNYRKDKSNKHLRGEMAFVARGGSRLPGRRRHSDVADGTLRCGPVQMLVTAVPRDTSSVNGDGCVIPTPWASALALCTTAELYEASGMGFHCQFRYVSHSMVER
jgi:hypothetical protein